MSVNVTTAAIEQFRSLVHMQFQGQQMLANTTNESQNLLGDSFQIPIMQRVMAKLRTGSSTDVVPVNTGYSVATLSPLRYDAPDYVDMFDEKTINFDEENYLVKNAAYALGRRIDQIKIDALYASGTSNTVAVTTAGIGVTGDDAEILNSTKLKAAAKYMNANGVPTADRFLAINAEGLYQLMADKEITSSDYNTLRVLNTGQMDSYMGFNVIVIPDNEEGGLPYTTVSSETIRHAFAWDRNSMATGYYFNDMYTSIDWIPHKSSHLVNSSIMCGATAVDTRGIVEILFNESVSVSA